VVQLVEVVAHLVLILAEDVLHVRGQVVVVVVILVVALRLVDDVVASEVDGVSAGDDEEDLLVVTDGDIKGLLVVLHGGR
jgi:hypothetical protein